MAAVVGVQDITSEPDVDVDVARAARTKLNSAASEGPRVSQSHGATELVSFHRDAETATIQTAAGSSESVESKTHINSHLERVLSFKAHASHQRQETRQAAVRIELMGFWHKREGAQG